MAFERIYLTKKGAALLGQAHGGEGIRFSHVEIGTGAMTQGQSEELMEQLVQKIDEAQMDNPKISNLVVTGGRATLSFQFTNNRVVEPRLVWRELGVFAYDENDKPVLYAYANSGDKGDDILPASWGPVEFVYSVVLKVDGADSVQCDAVDEGAVFATKKELGAVKEEVDGLSVTPPCVNYLVNPDMNINQRGSASYTLSPTSDGIRTEYLITVDKWYVAQESRTATVTVSAGNGEGAEFGVANGSVGDKLFLRQKLHRTVLDGVQSFYLKGEYTGEGSIAQDIESVLVRINGVEMGELKNGVAFTFGEIEEVGNFLIIELEIPVVASAMKVRFSNMRLIKGNTDKAWLARTHHQELSECQKYYIQIYGADYGRWPIGFGRCTSTGWSEVTLPYDMVGPITARHAGLYVKKYDAETDVNGMIIVGITAISFTKQVRLFCKHNQSYGALGTPVFIHLLETDKAVLKILSSWE